MKKIVLFIFSIHLLMTLGCQTFEEKQIATQAPESYKDALLKAQNLSKTNPNLAISKLNQLLSSSPENNLSDDALFLMGDLLYKVGNKAAAEKSFSRILNSKYASPLDGRALIYRTKIISQQNPEAVLKSLRYVDENQLSDQKSLEKIELIRAPIFLKSEAFSQYLKSAAVILSQTKNQKLATETRRQALDVLKIKISPYNSQTVLNDPHLKIFHAQAALNIAQHFFDNDRPEDALNLLNQNEAVFQSQQDQSKRDEFIARGNIFLSSNVDVIGVILPLTGKYQSVGHQILKGLQYSMGVWRKNSRSRFKLAIMDSEGDPDQVNLAFNELIRKDKPVAIVGGLVSKTAEVLLKNADDFKVPTLVFSQKEGLTKRSRYGFQSYQSLEDYSAFIASIAYKNAGFQKVAILQSNQAFSKRYGAAFQKSFEKIGGEVTEIVEYNLKERRSLPNAVKKLVKLVSTGDRAKEYGKALAQWQKTTRHRGQGAIPKIEKILKPRIDFDALFISDGAKNGGLIASTLAYFDVEELPLLGTHLWNDGALIERGQRFVENAIFADSYHKPELQASSCGQSFFAKFQEPITSYIFNGIKAGTILNSSYRGFQIESRKNLLSALKSTSTLTDACIPKGMVKEGHNFTSSLSPLTVTNKTIAPLNVENIVKKTDESPSF